MTRTEAVVTRSDAVADRIAASKVAKRLNRYMADNGLDYRGLAKRLARSLSQAHDWATGEHDPNLENIKYISKRLRIELSELV